MRSKWVELALLILFPVWTEGPGRLQSMGSLRVRHDWETSLSIFTFTHWRREWQPTPMFLPGESQGLGSLMSCRLCGHTESDTTEVTQQQQRDVPYHSFHSSHPLLSVLAISTLNLQNTIKALILSHDVSLGQDACPWHLQGQVSCLAGPCRTYAPI